MMNPYEIQIPALDAQRMEEAEARLQQFSKWSRSKKDRLIGESNPARRDLTVKVYRHEEHL